MKKYLLVSFVLWISVACTGNKNKFESNYIFDPNKSIAFAETSFSKNKSVVEPIFSDSTLIGANSSLVFNKNRYYIFNKGGRRPVLVFDEGGRFCGNIGNIGNGPEEYPVVNDVAINYTNNNVEILSNTSILRYREDGSFVGKNDVPFPAFSFVIDESNYYWFYLGSGSSGDNSKVMRFDENFESKKGFLQQKSNLLPMFEINFGKSAYLTFRESLSHELYVIKDGSLDLTYQIDFPSYELPKDLHQMDPMKVVDVLHNKNYASIMSYFENDKYIFMYIFINKSMDNQTEKRMPDPYYWIINKEQKKELIIGLDIKVGTGSYLFNPQILSKENRLYCLGYVLETVEQKNKFVDENSNPSIVSFDLDNLF